MKFCYSSTDFPIVAVSVMSHRGLLVVVVVEMIKLGYIYTKRYIVIPDNTDSEIAFHSEICA